ncbi:MAG: tetratricopeptide repeat protein [Bacteroidota bacterium]|nr:tetratricopeptide repeat protein [Bacteroidota bacterium]
MNQRLQKLMEMEKQKPGDAFLNFAIAQEFVNNGDDEQAKNRFETLLKEQPAYLATYYQAGKLYERLDDTKRAIDTYQCGIIVAKNNNDLKTAGELNEALNLIVD